MILLKKILVATDFSAHSTKAVRYGAELAAKFNSELHLLYVVEPLPAMYGDGAYLPQETAADLGAGAVEELEGLTLDAANLQVLRKVVHGAPFVEIVRYAKENAIDLVVTGTHGRGAIAHMLLGSVAERVVRKASCPVLVVREEEHDFVLP